MRKAFAHQAVVLMPAHGDTRALGGAVTTALCGSWEHDPPCPLAPHHTRSLRSDNEIRVRVLFAVESEQEVLVRDRIDTALAAGAQRGPDGTTTRWELVDSHRSRVHGTEFDHANRLIFTRGPTETR